MKLTNQEILNTREPMKELSKVKMPVRTSLALIQLVRKLDEYLIPIEQVKDGLVKQYGKPPKDNPNQMAILPGDENWNKFLSEFGELMTQEQEVVIMPVMLPSSLEIEPAILVPLERFIGIEADK